MARQLGSTIPFVLWVLIAVGCKSSPNQDPLRLDTMLSKKSANTPSSGFRLGPKNSQSVPSFGATASSSGVRSKLYQTAGSLKNAMTIHPKVIPAADPTSLSSDPGPIPANLYVSAAAVLEQQNRNAEAAAKYEQALAADASHREAMIGLGRLRHREGNLVGAIAVYQRALDAYPDDPVLLNDLGLCYARSEQPEMAQAVLTRAVELSPSNTLYRNNLAAVLVESNRSAEAVPMLAQSYGTAVAHYNVGYLLHKRGEDGAAVDHFLSSLKANPALEPARAMLHQLAPQLSARPTDAASGARPPVHNASSSRPVSGQSSGPVPLDRKAAEPSDASNTGPQPHSSWPARPAAYSTPVSASDPVIFNASASPVAANSVSMGTAVPQPVTASQDPPSVALPGLVRLPLPSRSSRKSGHFVPPAPHPVKPAFQAEFLPTFEGPRSP